MMRSTLALLIGLIAVIGGPASANAATVPLDALGSAGEQRIVHPTHPTRSAIVRNVGDIDGDDLDDLATATSTVSDGRDYVWVTYSPATLPSTTSPGDPGWRGFKITDENLEHSLTGLPDVNGDGLGEIVVYRVRNQEAFVVFGRSDGGTVDLGNLGQDGFTIRNVLLFTKGGGGGNDRYGGVGDGGGIEPLGDQNGDGRADLAFSEGSQVTVVYTPADPAGKVVDASDLGDKGYRLVTGGDWEGNVARSLGDVNGDGRDDLAVFWSPLQGRWEDGVQRPFPERFSVHATGVYSPDPGSVVEVAEVAARGEGFDFVTDGENGTLQGGITVGDQNGDGLRDLILMTFKMSDDDPIYGEAVSVLYTPPAGTTAEARPTKPAFGYDLSGYANVLDLGDIDGDGVSDIKLSDKFVRFSSTGEVTYIGPRKVRSLTDSSQLGDAISFPGDDMILADTVADRNGDGLRELVAAHAEPLYPIGQYVPHDADGTWITDVFLSATTPEPLGPPEAPVELPDGYIELSVPFRTATDDSGRSLAGRAAVELTTPDGMEAFVASPDILDLNAGSADATVAVDSSEVGLSPGDPFTYRILLENNRGQVGVSDRASARGAAKCGVVRGTNQPDRLRGTDGCDRISAKKGRDRLAGVGGKDQLFGGPGRDKLRGGPGADRLVGGRGRDVLICGLGKDVAIAARGEKTRGCERVKRVRGQA